MGVYLWIHTTCHIFCIIHILSHMTKVFDRFAFYIHHARNSPRKSIGTAEFEPLNRTPHDRRQGTRRRPTVSNQTGITPIGIGLEGPGLSSSHHIQPKAMTEEVGGEPYPEELLPPASYFQSHPLPSYFIIHSQSFISVVEKLRLPVQPLPPDIYFCKPVNHFTGPP